eukprot:CCRYP_003664-RA/>CCRYP_003664-RA protein AED:0.86 eAED:-0.58 QI:0/-1/0/1/-1/1/1/0/232
MEADFNAANKILFGRRMLDNVRQYSLMPEEIFSERQRMAEDGILAKVLFYDISRQLRAPAALASVDAANCYDRVAHAVASLVFRSFGASLPMTTSMLTAIQQMKFFLRTAYGDSDRAVGAKLHLRTQGFMQGMAHRRQVGQQCLLPSSKPIRDKDMERPSQHQLAASPRICRVSYTSMIMTFSTSAMTSRLQYSKPMTPYKKASTAGAAYSSQPEVLSNPQVFLLPGRLQMG